MTNGPDVLPRTTDVLVIGFGPVGAALCALLGRYGVTALAVDKVAEVVMAPRAIALDNEALRILQMAGLGEGAFERLAIPEVRMHCPYLGQFGRANTCGTIDGHPSWSPSTSLILSMRFAGKWLLIPMLFFAVAMSWSISSSLMRV